MGVHRFSVGESVKEGFRLTKQNLAFLVLYQVFLFFLAFIFSGEINSAIRLIWHVVGWVIMNLAWMGFYNSALLMTKQVKPSFDQLYKNWRLLVSWIVGHIIFGLAIAIGFVLLIIPGCYILSKYGLFPFFILDKEQHAIEALKSAGKASEGSRWQLFLFFLTYAGINILGALFFGIGIVFTLPVTLLAFASIYRKLTSVT